VEGRWGKIFQPSGRSRGRKRQKLNADDMGKKYVAFLKEIGKRTGETSSDSDRMFLLNAMKELSPFHNSVEV
jgi:hypothetical protein